MNKIFLNNEWHEVADEGNGCMWCKHYSYNLNRCMIFQKTIHDCYGILEDCKVARKEALTKLNETNKLEVRNEQSI